MKEKVKHFKATVKRYWANGRDRTELDELRKDWGEELYLEVLDLHG